MKSNSHTYICNTTYISGQQKRSTSKSPDLSHLQAQYATNFGANQGSNKTIDAFVIETVLRVLVTRFALMHKELKMLDNSVILLYLMRTV